MRALDIVISSIGLVLLSPILIFVVIAIKLSSSGPSFYCAMRVGQFGRPFRLYKFRTMFVNAHDWGSGITKAGDERVTPLGRILRNYKLDELPQLVNVLSGDMSLVGPRPEDPRYVAYYTPEQACLLKHRPGITSVASLAYRHEEEFLTGENWERVYIEEVLPAKLSLELAYQARRTAWSDLVIVLKTVVVVLRA